MSTPSSHAAWSAYWQAGAATACLPGAPEPVQKLLVNGWQDFATALPANAPLLDLACGAGAVVAAILRKRRDLVITGVDLADIPADPPGWRAMGGVDCAALPFADGEFMAATSQFGLEYCAPAALAEAARVLAPGGQFRFLVHAAGSVAVAHNRARLAAMQAMTEAGLFRLARQAAGGFQDAALAGAVARARRSHAAQGITAELPMALQQALRGAQPLAAIGAIEARARGEMARLAAMQDAAKDAAGIAAMAEILIANGTSATVETVALGREPPLAWLVRGSKPG